MNELRKNEMLVQICVTSISGQLRRGYNVAI